MCHMRHQLPSPELLQLLTDVTALTLAVLAAELTAGRHPTVLSAAFIKTAYPAPDRKPPPRMILRHAQVGVPDLPGVGSPLSPSAGLLRSPSAPQLQGPRSTGALSVAAGASAGTAGMLSPRSPTKASHAGGASSASAIGESGYPLVVEQAQTDLLCAMSAAGLLELVQVCRGFC